MFPYLVLTIFFFRGITLKVIMMMMIMMIMMIMIITLKGATAGLAHMFTPKVETTMILA